MSRDEQARPHVDAAHSASAWDVLLCIVRWAHPESPAKPSSLAEVSPTEIAVCWRDHPSVEAARAEMERRCAVPSMCEDTT